MAKKRKQRKKKQEPIVISENLLAEIVPGMLRSANELFKLKGAIENDDKLNVLSIGISVSNTMIITQCCELLLKYKLQLEGTLIEKTHDLSKLFRSLSEDSQKDIEKEYQAYISTLSDPPILEYGWGTVESIFVGSHDAFVYWRYIVTIDTNSKGSFIFPGRLYIAALSVYNSIPKANLQLIGKEITDLELKAAIFEHPTDK